MRNGLVQVCSEASPRNWTFGNIWHLIVLLKLKVAIQEICTLLYSTSLQLAWSWGPSPKSRSLAHDKSGSRMWRQWWHFVCYFFSSCEIFSSEASPRNWSWIFGNMWHLIMLLKLEVAIQEICTLFESSDCWCPQGPTNLWWDTAKVLVACLPSQIWFGLDLLWKTSWSSLIPYSSLPTGLCAQILRHIHGKVEFAHLLTNIWTSRMLCFCCGCPWLLLTLKTEIAESGSEGDDG